MARLTTTPPLRSAKGDASAASRGMPEIHRNTPVIPADNNRRPIHSEAPSPTTTRPLSREPSPSPSQGEIKRGSQGEGNRAAKGRGPHPNNHPLNHRNNPLLHPSTPSFPSFPIFRILVQVFPKVPQFQNAPFSAKYPYFPTQHLTDTALLY